MLKITTSNTSKTQETTVSDYDNMTWPELSAIFIDHLNGAGFVIDNEFIDNLPRELDCLHEEYLAERGEILYV